jgi:Pyruvate/2-oxoacid:ferredoxin oxidoreductase gamma subunit
VLNDFVIRFANVNGTGSASANTIFAKSVFRMGIPVTPKNIFPSNIQGLPTWYEVRVSEKVTSADAMALTLWSVSTRKVWPGISPM